MTHPVEDQMLFVSQLYPDFYTQVAPEQAGKKTARRRRRKSKGEGSGGGGMKKRKLSEEQASQLETSFWDEHKLESERKDRLASELGLDPRQVAVWFQNRRARWKSQKMEQEYSKLKAAHEGVVLEKCRLEAQVVMLKDQLSEKDKEIQRLSQRGEGVSSNSTSSSMEAVDPRFLGELGAEALESIFYLSPESDYIHQGIDWVYQM